MSKCLRPISVNDMNVHEKRVTSLMELFLTNGTVTEADMDALGVPNINDQ